MPLDAALPHLDPGPFEGRPAEQVRLRMEFLDVAADGDRFADDSPVVELGQRDRLQRIEGGEFRGLVFELAEIDLDPRNRDAFLGEEDPHAARVRGKVGIVQLQASLRPIAPLRRRAAAPETTLAQFAAKNLSPGPKLSAAR